MLTWKTRVPRVGYGKSKSYVVNVFCEFRRIISPARFSYLPFLELTNFLVAQFYVFLLLIDKAREEGHNYALVLLKSCEGR